MPTIDELDLVINAVDQFSGELQELEERLVDVGTTAKTTVENIDAHVDIDDAMEDLTTLAGTIETLDDSTIDIYANYHGVIGEGVERDERLPHAGSLRDAETGRAMSRDDGTTTLENIFDDITVREVDIYANYHGVIGEGVERDERLPHAGSLRDAETGRAMSRDDGTTTLENIFDDITARDVDIYANRVSASSVATTPDGGVSGLVSNNEYQTPAGVFDLTLPNATDNPRALIGSTFDGGERPLPERLAQRIRDISSPIPERYQDFNLTFGQFYDALADLIPLFLLLGGALPAAIAGLGALAAAGLAAAGALYAVGGLGVMGLMATDGGFSTTALQEHVDRLVTVFEDAFLPLAQQFAPMAEQAVDDLAYLIQDLARHGDILLGFRDEFAQLTRYLSRNTAPVLAQIAGLSMAMMPLVDGVLGALSNSDFIQPLARSLAEIFPLLVRIGHALHSLFPVLLDISTGMLYVATTVITLIGTVATFIGKLGPLAKVLGVLIGVTLVTVTALSLLGSVQTALSVLQPIVAQAVFLLSGSLQGLGVSGYFAAGAIATLLSVLTLGIGAVAIGIGERFLQMSDSVQEATTALQEFGSVSQSLDGTAPFASGAGSDTPSGASVYVDRSETVYNGMSKGEAMRAEERSGFASATQTAHPDSQMSGY